MKNKILKIINIILVFCSRIYLKKKRIKSIGITWSVWKTSSRVIISEVLKKFLENRVVYTSPKNFNSELGLIFSIYEIEKYTPSILGFLKVIINIIIKTFISKPSYDVIVLEYGIDHPWDMDFLLNIIKPDISIFTKLDAIHLENFDSIEAIWDEKFNLMKKTKDLTYLNFKDDYCRKKHDIVFAEKRFYNWKDIEVLNYSLEQSKKDNKVLASFEITNKKIKTNLLGEENANYISIWFDILDYITTWNYKREKEYYINFELQSGRFSIYPWINNSILIDSSYNAWPASMEKMINNTLELKNKIFSNYKVWLVLWDMRELWEEETKKAHEWLKKYIKKADLVYTIWKEMKKYLAEEKSFLSSREAWKDLKKFLKEYKDKYLILFKGSQNTIFIEEALKEIILNKKDKKKLVRQDDYWLEKKERYFNSL